MGYLPRRWVEAGELVLVLKEEKSITLVHRPKNFELVLEVPPICQFTSVASHSLFLYTE